MKRMVVAGHICLDITPEFPMDQKAGLNERLVPGTLVHMEGVHVHTGGAVANTGLALKLLGAEVSLMGKIGADAFGRLVLDQLSQHVDTKDLIISDDSHTSYSIVLSPPGTDRIFLHSPGANDTFSLSDLPLNAVREAALFHFGYPPAMKLMYQNEGEQLVKLFQTAKQWGVITSLDMAAVDPLSEAGQADWETIIAKVLPYVDIFTPSVEELCFMIDRKSYRKWKERANGQDISGLLSISQDIRPLADKLLDMGAKAVLIKCGAPGLYFRAASRSIWEAMGISDTSSDEWSVLEVFEPSYVPDRMLSATGAGDTSIAAFLLALLQGKPLAHSLRLAAATGASCVTEYDALSGLRSFEALEEKMLAGWPKQSLIHD